jgi:hypothetical protein
MVGKCWLCSKLNVIFNSMTEIHGGPLLIVLVPFENLTRGGRINVYGHVEAITSRSICVVAISV